ncbi:conserved protein of unknown function [Xenorhabdus bovienii]|uniref:Phage tail protein C-terminal domain-containing protein n=1 Tax=Xenorhabdus bovienii TaxID=40576 RepID=A0A0B6X5Y0_XENBV|nr:conserved protein of unknown function [Xenorhabdus bovienii]
MAETRNQAQNAVPNRREINGKALTADVNLNAQDVGAASINDSMRLTNLDGWENIYNGCSGFTPDAPFLNRYGISPEFGVQLRFSNLSGTSSEGVDDVWSHRLIFMHRSDTYRTDYINSHSKITRKFWDDMNAKPDVNGNLKISSPIVEIHPDGTLTTNDESQGAIVTKLGIGHYQIFGILGYNADGAWGLHGGISSPKNNNGLELVYIDDKVKKDGSITIETFHRQHVHLPERFQNWRVKNIVEGKQVYYADSEPCDIPEGCRLDVRVQMPESSIWNQRQRKASESE